MVKPLLRFSIFSFESQIAALQLVCNSLGAGRVIKSSKGLQCPKSSRSRVQMLGWYLHHCC